MSRAHPSVSSPSNTTSPSLVARKFLGPRPLSPQEERHQRGQRQRRQHQEIQPPKKRGRPRTRKTSPRVSGPPRQIQPKIPLKNSSGSLGSPILGAHLLPAEQSVSALEPSRHPEVKETLYCRESQLRACGYLVTGGSLSDRLLLLTIRFFPGEDHYDIMVTGDEGSPGWRRRHVSLGMRPIVDRECSAGAKFVYNDPDLGLMVVYKAFYSKSEIHNWISQAYLRALGCDFFLLPHPFRALNRWPTSPGDWVIKPIGSVNLMVQQRTAPFEWIPVTFYVLQEPLQGYRSNDIIIGEETTKQLLGEHFSFDICNKNPGEFEEMMDEAELQYLCQRHNFEPGPQLSSQGGMVTETEFQEPLQHLNPDPDPELYQQGVVGMEAELQERLQHPSPDRGPLPQQEWMLDNAGNYWYQPWDNNLSSELGLQVSDQTSMFSEAGAWAEAGYEEYGDPSFDFTEEDQLSEMQTGMFA